jgi:hypothetical protein
MRVNADTTNVRELQLTRRLLAVHGLEKSLSRSILAPDFQARDVEDASSQCSVRSGPVG